MVRGRADRPVKHQIDRKLCYRETVSGRSLRDSVYIVNQVECDCSVIEESRDEVGRWWLVVAFPIDSEGQLAADGLD